MHRFVSFFCLGIVRDIHWCLVLLLTVLGYFRLPFLLLFRLYFLILCRSFCPICSREVCFLFNCLFSLVSLCCLNEDQQRVVWLFDVTHNKLPPHSVAMIHWQLLSLLSIHKMQIEVHERPVLLLPLQLLCFVSILSIHIEVPNQSVLLLLNPLPSLLSIHWMRVELHNHSVLLLLFVFLQFLQFIR